MHFQFRTQGVCARQIDFDLDDDGRVRNIAFFGGCNGNLKAISKLVDGWTPKEISDKLAGNTCGNKPTSCADQLAIAVMQAQAQRQAGR